MLNFEWLRSYDPLRVIARNEAIQTISILNYMKTSKRLTMKMVSLFAFFYLFSQKNKKSLR